MNACQQSRPRCVTGRVRIGRERLRQARRRREQRVRCLAIAHQMHEAAYCFGFTRIIWNSSRLEGVGSGAACAEPDGEHRLRVDEPHAMRLHACNDRLCGVRRGSKRCRNIHDQDGIICGVADQCLERGAVARAIRIACDIDRICPRPDRRQCSVQPLHGLGRDVRERAAEIGKRVNCEYTDSATVR